MVTLPIQDLKYPVGELQPSMFPDGDLDANLQLWLADAKLKVAGLDADLQNAAAAAWVYHRAYTAVALRIGNTPTTDGSFGDRSTTWSGDRVGFFQTKAKEWLATFTGYTASVQSPGGISAVSAVLVNEAVW